MAMNTVFYIAIGMCAILMSTQAESTESGERCPTFWTPFGEAYYRLIAKPETWADAEAKCQQLGNGIVPGMEGHLSSIHDQDESDFVQSYYESSAIVQGRRKKTAEPNSYNSLWLGLNNQGPNLDTFVWSDKTEISTTFWQDTLYDTNHNCGYTWMTSSSKYRGKWNDASCTTRLPYLCKLLPTKQDDTEVIDEQTFSYSSSMGLLPCSYSGTIILHGDTHPVNDCTNCTCDNSTVKCNVEKCPPTPCEEPVKPKGECCKVCPDHADGIIDEPTSSYSSSSSGDVSTSHRCVFRSHNLALGETLRLGACTSCICNEKAFHCEIRSCRPTFCAVPITRDDECCEICPYDVPVYDVHLSGVDSAEAGTVNDISVDLRVSLNEDGQSVTGNDLWKVGMWASRNADGSGKKIGFVEQVLTNEQASRNLNRPPIFGGFEFLIPDINFSLDASHTSCKKVQYLCASFNMGDAPETQWKSRIVPVNATGFEVYGVESELNLSPNPASLIGCQPFTNCMEKRRKMEPEIV